MIVLTARGSWHEKVQGIDSGADDYLSKPFRMEELLARLRALIRRSTGQITPELRCGTVALDTRLSKVTSGGVPVKLTSHEFRVLSYLMHHRGRVGAVLWTLGLLPIVHAVSLVLILRGIAGMPADHLHEASSAHTGDVVRIALHDGSVLAGALVLMAAGVLLIRSGLSPINQLRTRLAGVHDGRDRRVEGSYPTEVQPLVNDLNALLDHREETVRRAIAKAGDLAHGLKTPLSVLAHEADRARDASQPELARAISEQVERMRRQIDYHLAQARAAASGSAPGTQCAVATSIQGLARTLERLHAERRIAIDVRVAPDHIVRAQREDVDEMVGNLLDNACKWANSRVSVASEKHAATVVVVVDDDGPGLAASLREAVLQRGVRADEAAPGTGFGLAIVRELATVYGGSISLAEAPMGGLRARLSLPAC